MLSSYIHLCFHPSFLSGFHHWEVEKHTQCVWWVCMCLWADVFTSTKLKLLDDDCHETCHNLMLESEEHQHINLHPHHERQWTSGRFSSLLNFLRWCLTTDNITHINVLIYIYANIHIYIYAHTLYACPLPHTHKHKRIVCASQLPIDENI